MSVKLIAHAESGQAMLIIILVMVVGLTTGLSVALRTITNLRIANEEENSQRAFYAAEAGIEQALRANQTGSVITDKQLDADVNKAVIKQVNVTSTEGVQVMLAGGNPIEKDDGMDIWLVPRSTTVVDYSQNQWSGNLTLYWGQSADDCQNAAMELVVLRDSDAAGNIAAITDRSVADPCSSRRTNNNFSAPAVPTGELCAQRSFRHKLTVSITRGMLARAVPLYKSAIICVDGGGVAFPSQGVQIESIGAAGGTKRKVVLHQGYPKVPAELFQYSLFVPVR